MINFKGQFLLKGVHDHVMISIVGVDGTLPAPQSSAGSSSTRKGIKSFSHGGGKKVVSRSWKKKVTHQPAVVSPGSMPQQSGAQPGSEPVSEGSSTDDYGFGEIRKYPASGSCDDAAENDLTVDIECTGDADVDETERRQRRAEELAKYANGRLTPSTRAMGINIDGSKDRFVKEYASVSPREDASCAAGANVTSATTQAGPVQPPPSKLTMSRNGESIAIGAEKMSSSTRNSSKPKQSNVTSVLKRRPVTGGYTKAPGGGWQVNSSTPQRGSMGMGNRVGFSGGDNAVPPTKISPPHTISPPARLITRSNSFSGGSTSPANEQTHRIEVEIEQLVHDIQRIGTPGTPQCTFAELFDDEYAEQYYEALVGTLKSAKKRGVIGFKGQFLLKGMSDKVVIKLLKD
eukprot:CAMPEP_0171319102 /NCGR_PEP_ID=MMETSP0816-20121228/93811_1 /TAXON_ID=420281 /ORGANISM="Proboscia inermis, Strain CCAP1064/1" /LENGTH=402 /DNA_ID=CAMNT_0011814379 /DNA_START=328 /DNA_END=1536 /DNA_ORIENTATION=-